MIDKVMLVLSCVGALFVALRALYLDAKIPWFEKIPRSGKLDREK